MQKLLWPLLLALGATPALAKDFQQRLAQARQAAATGPGQAYDQALNTHLPAVVRACIQSRDLSVHGSSFTLVADVQADGSIRHAEVQPKHRISQCVAERFSASALPPPPSGASGSGWPIFAVITLQ